MKLSPRPATPPTLVDALARAIGPGGASELDPSVPAQIWQRALSGPAFDFLSRPGKELRASIVRAGSLLGGGDLGETTDRVAFIIEVLHAGSLIVDDVQDSSRERRGGPTLHERYGVPLAINTGSWMYFWAQAELAELGLSPQAELEAQRATITTLARCHQGQALDLSVRVADIDVAEVPAVVAATTRLKTASLCRLAAELGAIAADTPAAQRQATGRFGEAMGTSLQMLDDLGSLTSPRRRTKGYEDLRAGRPTWPWAWLAQHRSFAWSRCAALGRAVTEGSGDADALIAVLTEEIGAIGRSEVRATLEAARNDLETTFGTTPVIDRVFRDLASMEHSFG